jgi:hypothetical protein
MYCHLVEVDETSSKLIIYRVYFDGRKELYTQVDLPVGAKETDSLGAFCRMLGENLLLDSPVARKLLNL